MKIYNKGEHELNSINFDVKSYINGNKIEVKHLSDT